MAVQSKAVVKEIVSKGIKGIDVPEETNVCWQNGNFGDKN
jgi:hypothetical protein